MELWPIPPSACQEHTVFTYGTPLSMLALSSQRGGCNLEFWVDRKKYWLSAHMSRGFCVAAGPAHPCSFFVHSFTEPFSLGMASRGACWVFSPEELVGGMVTRNQGRAYLSHRCPCLAQGNLDTFCSDMEAPRRLCWVLQASDQGWRISMEWPFTPLRDLRLSLTKGSLTSSPTCVNLGDFLTARVSAVCPSVDWHDIRNTATSSNINFMDNFTWGSDDISSRIALSPVLFVTVRLCWLESQAGRGQTHLQFCYSGGSARRIDVSSRPVCAN